VEAKSLSVRPVSLSLAALEAFERCLRPHVDATAGLCSIEDVCRGAQVYEIREAGTPIAWYAVRVDHYTGGDNAVIVAAAGRRPGVDLTAVTLAALERQFSRCAMLTAITRRPFLARKLVTFGFAPTGFVLRKRLQCH